MTRLVRAEWRKLTTLRGPLATVAAVLGLTALITPIAMNELGGTTVERDAREVLSIGPGLIASLAFLLLGAMAAAGEFQHRTIVPTYLITPRRSRVLGAKLIALGAIGAVVSALAVAISFPIVLAMAEPGIDIGGAGDLTARGLSLVAVGALSAMIGVGVGSLLRHQTASLLVVLLWAFVFERFLADFIPPVLPFSEMLSATGMSGQGDDTPTIVALAVVAAWAAGLALVARVRSIERDVT
jgi:uncharacterized membrane protein